jgi:hypothetical protein
MLAVFHDNSASPFYFRISVVRQPFSISCIGDEKRSNQKSFFSQNYFVLALFSIVYKISCLLNALDG